MNFMPQIPLYLAFARHWWFIIDAARNNPRHPYLLILNEFESKIPQSWRNSFVERSSMISIKSFGSVTNPNWHYLQNSQSFQSFSILLWYWLGQKVQEKNGFCVTWPAKIEKKICQENNQLKEFWVFNGLWNNFFNLVFLSAGRM